MRELNDVLQALRLVHAARRRFVEMWAVERQVINPALDRMADELCGVAGTPEQQVEAKTPPDDSSRDGAG